MQILSEFRYMSTGTLLDMVIRKIMLKVYKRRTNVMVRVGGRRSKIRLRPMTTDAEVVWQCFHARQYEIPSVVGAPKLHRNMVTSAYSNLVESRKIPLIIDCGANIGASTLWFKMRYPSSRIVAVEPAPDNLEMLASNCAKEKDIEILAAGIASESHDAFLHDSGGGAWGYQTSKSETGISIKMVSVAAILENLSGVDYSPFILKIDIEGAEKELFEGSWEMFKKFPVIIFESHDFYMPMARTSSPFFSFHSETGRDFMFGMENVFSIDTEKLLAITNKSTPLAKD